MAVIFCDDIDFDIEDVDSEYDQADGLASPINSEDGDDNPRFPEFRVEVDMSIPTFKIEMLFNDHLEFKEAIKEYKIKWGYPLFLVKNESGRVRHKCENCE